jgi:predicted Zn-dependent peptidase
MIPVACTTLDNGLPLLLAPMPETPRMALAVAIDGGFRLEPEAGIARLCSRLLLKGTRRRSAEALALELDERAIDLSESARTDCLVLQAVFINRELPAVIDLVHDIIAESTFADFAKEREKTLGEVRAAMDLPGSLANSLIIRAMFPDHPYGNSGLRFLDSAPSLREEQVREWYERLRAPRHMNLVLVGDFDLAEVQPLLRERFGSLAAADIDTTGPAPTLLTTDQTVSAARPDAQQAQVMQGWYAPPQGDDRQAALVVMNTILGGGGLSNRLFVNLRDKQGLAYSVYSRYQPMRQAGEFFVSIGTSPENIARARQGFAAEIARMQQEPVSSDELENAKGRLRGGYILNHETTADYCLEIAVNHINGLGVDFSERMMARVDAVTVDDVQAAAQLIQPPSVTSIVAREEALRGL